MGASRNGRPRAGEPGQGRLQIGLLGPMQRSVDGIDLTAGRLRTLLALLALTAGDSVSVDRLVAAIWDSRLPADARSAVQVYVARLRAEPDQVDALRFASERRIDLDPRRRARRRPGGRAGRADDPASAAGAPVGPATRGAGAVRQARRRWSSTRRFGRGLPRISGRIQDRNCRPSTPTCWPVARRPRRGVTTAR